jgi:predicted HTH domain antitoxin
MGKRKRDSDDEDEDYVLKSSDDECDAVCDEDEEEEVHKPVKRSSSNKRQRASRHVFTDHEEEKLKLAVIKYQREDGTINWKKAARDVNPKLHYKQVFQHYKRVTLARRNHVWSKEEDLELLHYVTSQGDAVQMAAVARQFYDGHFPDNQLRHRYENHVRDSTKLHQEYANMDQEQVLELCDRNVRMRKTWANEATNKDEKREPSLEEEQGPLCWLLQAAKRIAN